MSYLTPKINVVKFVNEFFPEYIEEATDFAEQQPIIQFSYEYKNPEYVPEENVEILRESDINTMVLLVIKGFNSAVHKSIFQNINDEEFVTAIHWEVFFPNK